MKPDRPDALIISDPGVFTIAKEVCPEIERHVSTQANNTNYGTYLFWKEQGASRVVTARELSLKEIKEIRERILFRMILRLKHLFMVPCVFPIRADVCCPIILQEEMQTRVPAHIRAAGSMRWLKKSARENTFRYMKTSVDPISLTQRICA